MSVGERRNAKRQLRRKAARRYRDYMRDWLDRADNAALPSAGNPYGGLDARGVARAARRGRKLFAPQLEELPGFLRSAAEEGIADAVARHGKLRRRPGRRRRWWAGAFTRGPLERIDALVHQGMGPKKAAAVVASELMTSRRVTSDALYKTWLSRPRRKDG